MCVFFLIRKSDTRRGGETENMGVLSNKWICQILVQCLQNVEASLYCHFFPVNFVTQIISDIAIKNEKSGGQHWYVVKKTATCNTWLPYGHWCVSWLLQFLTNSLLMVWLLNQKIKKLKNIKERKREREKDFCQVPLN